MIAVTAKRMGGKDVEGRYNIWLAVLLNRQGRPNSTHHQPIPFDNKNSRPVKRIKEKWTNYSLRCMECNAVVESGESYRHIQKTNQEKTNHVEPPRRCKRIGSSA